MDASAGNQSVELSKHYSALFDLMPEGVMLFDDHGVINTVNAFWERKLGRVASSLIGQKISSVFPELDHERLAPLLHCADEPGHEHDSAEFPHAKCAHQNGSAKQLHLRFGCVSGGANAGTKKIYALLASAIQDGSAKSPQAIELHALQDLINRIEDADPRKQVGEISRHLVPSCFTPEFISHVSQEIRTPLNGVVAVADILLGTDLSPEQREYAYTIKASGKALQEIIDDMLLLARAESGKGMSEVTDTEVVPLVEGTIRLMADKAELKNILLVSFIAPEVPAVIKCGALRLRQILLHMLRNSFKFTNSGEISIQVRVVEGEQRFLRFAVRDSGVGISSQQMERLFMPFATPPVGRGERHGEIGLGLTVCKSMVTLMGGDIGCTSQEGKYSEFWFTVPLVESSVVPERIANSSILRDMRWLVVAGRSNLHQLLCQYGKAWHMEIDVANNGEEAIKALRKKIAEGQPYHYLSCEFVLGDEPVYTLVNVARELGLMKETRAILLSSYNEPGLGIKAIKSGYSAYLVSPVIQTELLDCLTNISSVESDLSKQEAAMQEDSEQTRSLDISGVIETGVSNRVLVAEDSQLNQRILALLLSRLGFEVDFASDGQHAVDQANRAKYCLIFMDCRMPLIDGYRATQMIRAKEALTGHHIPIVAITASVDDEDREKCIEAGMDDYMAKPFEFETLEKILTKWVPAEH